MLQRFRFWVWSAKGRHPHAIRVTQRFSAFLLPSRADLVCGLVHARKLNVLLQGGSDHIVSEAVYLADSDGNRIDVYADRADADGTRIGLDDHTPVLCEPWATTTEIEQ